MHFNYRTQQWEPGLPKDWADILPQDDKTQVCYQALLALGYAPMDAAQRILEDHLGLPHLGENDASL